MNDNTGVWQDEFGASISVRAGAVGLDLDITDSDKRVINVSLPYNSDFVGTLTRMYINRDGSLPDVSTKQIRDVHKIARRIAVAHQVGHAVGLHEMADAAVAMYEMARQDERYAMVLAALMGAYDDLD